MRMCVTEGVRHMIEKIELQPALPHFNRRALQRACSKQRRLRMQLLKIAADGDGLADQRSIIEFKQRHALEWVKRRKCGGAMLMSGKVNIDRLRRDILLREKYPHT